MMTKIEFTKIVNIMTPAEKERLGEKDSGERDR